MFILSSVAEPKKYFTDLQLSVTLRKIARGGIFYESESPDNYKPLIKYWGRTNRVGSIPTNELNERDLYLFERKDLLVNGLDVLSFAKKHKNEKVKS